jgi:multiple sugar transport system permease protein
MRKAEPGALVFLAPALGLLAAVALYPLLYVFWLSLHQKLLIFDVSAFVGLENYRFLLRDDRFWSALANTLYFTIVSVGLELGLGLGFALLLRESFLGKSLLRTILLLPWVVPTVVTAKMWEWMYQPDFGLINYLLGTSVNWLGSPAWALHAAIVMDVWKTTPFVALILLAGLQTISPELYQAARVDGASSWTIFTRLTLPLLRPFILIALVFRSLDAFRVFDAIYVLTGGGPANTTETLSIYAYKVLFQTLQFGLGSAIAATVFLGVGLLTALYLTILGRRSL